MFPFPTDNLSRTSVALFISKLYEMFNDKNGSSASYEFTFENVLIVKNIEIFTNEIIPLYFKNINYKAFEKQLLLYDFKRYPTPSSRYQGYRHDNFIHDRPDLLPNIQRKIRTTASSNIPAEVIPQRINNTTGNMLATKSSTTTSSSQPHTMQELFNLQTKFLKSELYTIGVNMQKKLLEQDTEIKEVKSILHHLQTNSTRQPQPSATLPTTNSSYAAPTDSMSSNNATGQTDSILQSFASLIEMYAQPVTIDALPTTSGTSTASRTTSTASRRTSTAHREGNTSSESIEGDSIHMKPSSSSTASTIPTTSTTSATLKRGRDDSDSLTTNDNKNKKDFTTPDFI